MAEMCNVSLDHVALCANKSPNCLDIGPNELVSFGSSRSVVVYEPFGWSETGKQKIKTFNEHKGNVLCTKWISSINDDGHSTKTDFLLSGSTDKNIACWVTTTSESNSDIGIKLIALLKGHKESVTGLDGISLKGLMQNCNDDLYVIASTSADSSVMIWIGHSNIENIKNTQTIDFKNGFVLDIALQVLPNCYVPILACACDDFKVRLYTPSSRWNEEETFNFHNILTMQGHEDWVRGIDFIHTNQHELNLASCSQDSFIRLWKISEVKEINDKNVDDLQLKQQHFSIETSSGIFEFSATIDAVLSGHENWVYSIHWSRSNGKIHLLSTSMDKTVVTWNYDEETEMWEDDARMGEVGGNTLGFYGAHFSSDGRHIIAHSYSGALHGWDKINDNWEPAILVSGHSFVVNDIDWEPKYGRYLLSVSDDQTTRLYTEWNGRSWHEIARPQIHGYDIQCFGMLNSVKYVCGADEKVLRVFEASRNFVENLNNLTNYNVMDDILEAPEGATVPALGLSNKAVFQKQERKSMDRREQYVENLFSPIRMDQPPPETYLLQNTLWPETRKIYGHVYEIFCLACSHDETMVASSAKSSQPKHSGIIIWDVETWQEITTLTGHTLTVTQIEFSPNDKFLLSVSRDRTWMLHLVQKLESGYKFSVAARSEKHSCHNRIIWSCSWSHDSILFSTASRDKKIMVWNVSAEENAPVGRVSVTDCKEPVTAVAFSPSIFKSGKYLLSIGLESGKIKIYELNPVNFQLNELQCFNQNLSHCLAVKRLRWRPFCRESNDIDDKYDDLCLASSSQDHQVKVFHINFT